jgi:hypothetical protein
MHAPFGGWLGLAFGKTRYEASLFTPMDFFDDWREKEISLRAFCN